jgi:uncharacterized protein YjbI with pentapeptide repeats
LADFTGASFILFNGTSAIFYNADLTSATFSKVDFTKANFTKAKMRNPIDITGNFANADLYESSGEMQYDHYSLNLKTNICCTRSEHTRLKSRGFIDVNLRSY